MPDANNDRVIGRLEGQLGAILTQLANNEKSAAESRAKVHERLDEMATAYHKIERLEERLSKIEPIADEFSRWRERGIGALMLITFFSAAMGAAIAAGARKLLAFVSG